LLCCPSRHLSKEEALAAAAGTDGVVVSQRRSQWDGGEGEGEALHAMVASKQLSKQVVGLCCRIKPSYFPWQCAQKARFRSALKRMGCADLRNELRLVRVSFRKNRFCITL
jgi:hypothetical protein